MTFCRAFYILFLVSLFVLTACGGGGGGGGSSDTDDSNSSSSDTDPGSTEDLNSISEFSGVLVNRFGRNQAFDALVLSADKGYQFPQIVDATETDRLTADGTIVDGLGGVETPLDLPYNNFSTNSERGNRAANVTSEFDLDSLRSFADNAAEKFGFDRTSLDEGAIGLALFANLSCRAFTPDQIIEGLINGTISVDRSNTWYIDGEVSERAEITCKLNDNVTPNEVGYYLAQIEIPDDFYQTSGTVNCDTSISRTSRFYTCITADAPPPGEGTLNIDIEHTFELKEPSTGGVYKPGDTIQIDVEAVITGYSYCCSVGNNINAYFKGSNKAFDIINHEGSGIETAIWNSDLPPTGNSTIFNTERDGTAELSATLSGTIPATVPSDGILKIELYGTNGSSVVNYVLEFN